MVKQKKEQRIETNADTAPLALSLGALLGRETPEAVAPAPVREEKAPPPRREMPGRAILSRETKGRGGKTVTRISFREGLPADATALAKSLRNGLGCGGTVEGDDIVLQGDQIERTAEWFAARKVKVTRGQ